MNIYSKNQTGLCCSLKRYRMKQKSLKYINKGKKQNYLLIREFIYMGDKMLHKSSICLMKIAQESVNGVLFILRCSNLCVLSTLTPRYLTLSIIALTRKKFSMRVIVIAQYLYNTKMVR